MRYALIAGEQALASYAYEEALAHFQRGLTAREGQAVDVQVAALLFGLGRAQAATLQLHQMHEVYISLNRAFDCYLELGAIDDALAVAEYPVTNPPGRSGATRLIAHALALIPPESHQAGRLLARYGRVLGVEEVDYDGAQEAFQRALTIARYEQDIPLEMWALTWGASVDAYHLRWPESLKKELQAAELARRIDEPLAEVWARHWAVHAYHVLGDLQGAIQQAQAGLTVAERLRDCQWLASMLWANEIVSSLQGQWEAARQYNNRGLALAPKDPRHLSTRALLEYQVGNVAAGAAYLEQLLGIIGLEPVSPTLEQGFSALALPATARITGTLEQLDTAEQVARQLLASTPAVPLVIHMTRIGLALVAVLRGDASLAAEQHTILGLTPGSSLLATIICTDRLLGLISQVLGEYDQAISHLEAAMAFCGRAGYRPEYA